MTNFADRQKSKTGSVNKYTWIPVALVLIPALATLGNLSWTTSILLGAPLAMISLFIPIDAAYICRFAPLGKAQMWRIILTHLAAAQVLSLLWMLIAGRFRGRLESFTHWHGFN